MQVADTITALSDSLSAAVLPSAPDSTRVLAPVTASMLTADSVDVAVRTAVTNSPSILDALIRPFFTDFWGTAESIATILALILGGVWAYSLFVRRRVARPRVNLAISAASAPGPPGHQLLQVRAVLVNCGEVLVGVQSIQLWVQQISPLPSEALADIEAHDPCDDEGPAEIGWPRIGSRLTTLEAGKAEIEPGESDEFVYDFVVPEEVSEVQVYAHITNTSKKKSNLGWQRTLRLRLPTSAEGGPGAPTTLLQTETVTMGSTDKGRPPERVEKQQAPKPAPIPLHEQRPPKAPPPVRDPGKKP